MYICFCWLQLSWGSMGVINTLQQLTFNILPQPLTQLMDDWLCKGWKPCSWEWHESIGVGQIEADCCAAEPLTPANTVWSHINHKDSDHKLFFFNMHFARSSHTPPPLKKKMLTLPFSSPWLALLSFVCISPQYPPSLQIPFPSSPAVLHNLISRDAFSEYRGTAFHFNQIQAFPKNP